MTDLSSLIEHNIFFLKQGSELLAGLDEHVYIGTVPPYHESSIGDHMRHSLEHYTSFMAGYGLAQIDYDARQRDERIARDRRAAVATIESIISWLANIGEEDQPILIKMDCDKDADSSSPWSPSSVKRELQYLLAHTIHHYALIALLLRLQDHVPHPDFGVAPSTLKYRSSLVQTAS